MFLVCDELNANLSRSYSQCSGDHTHKSSLTQYSDNFRGPYTDCLDKRLWLQLQNTAQCLLLWVVKFSYCKQCLLTEVNPSWSVLQFVFVPHLWRQQLTHGRRQVDGIALCVIPATEKAARPRFRLEWRQRCIVKLFSKETWKTNAWKVTLNNGAVHGVQNDPKNRPSLHFLLNVHIKDVGYVKNNVTCSWTLITQCDVIKRFWFLFVYFPIHCHTRVV